MTIIAASVEANGWVLRLDVTGTLGSFASYTLDPDGAPRVALTADHAGFAPAAGQAVATTLNRGLIGTRPLRVAAEVVGATLQPARIDETDLGGGLIRVRIALSEHVYATDSTLRLTLATGWRTGAVAASGIIVINNSSVVAPIPIMRWALPQLSVVNGIFRLSLVAFSHHPNGFQPCAGVKFTVTDGTNTKTVWTTALATDNSMGDNLRCYTVTVDPATATALTAGLLRCDAEVYPWLGSMRSTDPAGTRAMAGLRADAVSVNAATPFVVGYDPAGTRYGSMFAFVDPVNGTTTAAAAMVQSTLALAKAVAPGARPRDINTATQAGFLFNRTLPVANGVGTSVARSVDGMQVVLVAGTHADGFGSSTVTFGIATPEIPMRIIGDPADASPRVNCILQMQPSRAIAVNSVSRVLVQNLTWEIGGAAAMGTQQPHVLIDNCIVRGKSGFEANTVQPFGGTVIAGTWSFAMTRSRWWRTGTTVSQADARLGLMRACEHSRLVSTVQCAIRNRIIPRSEDVTLPIIQTGVAYSGWPSPTLSGQAEDFIVAYNDIRSWEGRAWLPSTLGAATAGTPSPSIRRQVFVGNLCERIATTRPTMRTSEPFFSIGEVHWVTASYNIVEGNTFAGERVNMFYNEPPATTLADVNTLNNSIFANRTAGNSFAYQGTKHDDFFFQAAADIRVANGQAANGFRPQLIGGWSYLYGVGHESNAVLWNSWTTATFAYLQYYGRQSHFTGAVPQAPVYVDDRSYDGSNIGAGNYMPVATSPVRGRVARGQCDVDINGTPRPALADAGAFQTVASALNPAGARSGTIARSPALGWTANLVPASSGVPHRGASTVSRWSAGLLTAASGLAHRPATTAVGWSASLLPSAIVSAHRTGATNLALRLDLAPAHATLGIFSSASILDLETLLSIEPASSRHIVTARSALLLTGTAGAGVTMIVAADPRSIIPTRN